LQIADIERQGESISACADHLGNSRLRPFQAIRQLSNDNSRARGSECPSGGSPDPGPGAGDEGGQAGEITAGL
jgi:hypothetical protein